MKVRELIEELTQWASLEDDVEVSPRSSEEPPEDQKNPFIDRRGVNVEP